MKGLLLFWMMIGAGGAFAQLLPEKGMPLLHSYSPMQYGNKGKIWGIQAAPNGVVYMAADGGLLEYDGLHWHAYKGSKGFTRSVWVANDSVIFTGSDLDFGVWKKNAYHQFSYTSLYPFQADAMEVSEEFWEIFPLKNAVAFRSSSNLYLYKNGQLIKIPAPSKFTGGYLLGESLYLSDQAKGLLVFDGVDLKPFQALPPNFEMVGLFQNGERLMVVGRNNGLFQIENGQINPWDSPLSELLKAARVFCFHRISPTRLAFGTVLKGVFVTDLNGQVIHHINRHKGLPNNTILSLHYTPSGQLWLGTDYGVAQLNIQHDITFFYDHRGDFGTAHTALLKDGVFYLGTNQGLHVAQWDDLNNAQESFDFQRIPQTAGQVWSLAEVDGSLLMGHDRGLFALNGQDIRKISAQEGVWNILPFNGYLLTGNYNGISVFKKEGNQWVFLKKLELILGSCNQLVQEDGQTLWVNIPNFGLIRCTLSPDMSLLNRQIFPEETFKGNHPALVRNETGIHLLTDEYLYSYRPDQQGFEEKPMPVVAPMIEGLLPGVYQPQPLADEYAFFPINNGFALQYKAFRAPDRMANTVIFRKIEAFNNEERKTILAGEIIPYDLNNLLATFVVPNQAHVQYQYKLAENAPWSEWSPDPLLELIDLGSGPHTLHIRASVGGQATETLTFTFRVAAPWYRSWPGFLIYSLLALLALYAAYLWKKVSLKKQHHQLLIKERQSLRQQAEKHQQQLVLMEQQRLQEEFEQLKRQLKEKTVELAQKAKENKEKNNLLVSLKEKIEALQQQPNNAPKKLRELQRLLEASLQTDDRAFEIQIDELHQEFFKKLKVQFPGLSSNDLRLCAYLKIGLNSKEIAEMLNIQPSSFYISRSRLRKKLGLLTDETLYDFLNSF